MKKLFYLTLLLVSFISFAQIPTGYYNSATGTGYTLKTQLHNIIKGHSVQAYGTLWVIYNHNAFKDVYYENDGTLLDIYSEKPNGPDSYSYIIPDDQNNGSNGPEGTNYNREHIVPQSVYGTGATPRTDAHQVIPVDSYVNGQRDDFPFGKVNSPNWTSTNGSKKGTSAVSGYSSTVFEPIDEFKGDIARMLFYFATRYEDNVSGWSFPMFNGTSNQVFTNGFLDILLQWHEQDPVSAMEIARNNRVYSYQNNRNPFVDHPEFAQIIWGQSSSVSDIEPIYVYVYPNPSKDNKINITTDTEIEEITLINLNGQIIQKVKNPHIYNGSYSLEDLPKGFYILNLNIDNRSITKKIIIN